MNSNTMMMIALAVGAYYGWSHGWFSSLFGIGGPTPGAGGGAPAPPTPGGGAPTPGGSGGGSGGPSPYAPGPPVYNPIPYPGGGTGPSPIPGASPTPPDPINTAGIIVPGIQGHGLGSVYQSLYLEANQYGGCMTWARWLGTLDALLSTSGFSQASQGNSQLNTIYCVGQAWPVISGMLQSMGMPETPAGGGLSGMGRTSPWDV